MHFLKAQSQDGPSAGITIATSIVSALTRSRCLYVAIPLNIRSEQGIANRRMKRSCWPPPSGNTTVILPKDNEKDLAEIPPEIQAD